MNLELGHLIQQEGAALSSVIDLILTEADPSTWPPSLVACFSLAMEEVGNDVEQEKARRLRSHLFLDFPIHDSIRHAGSTHGERRTAERIRADLADLLPCGAGLYLYERGTEHSRP